MKTLLILLALAVALSACQSRQRPPETPHTAALAAHLETAKSQAGAAQLSAARVGGALTAARSNAERIDAKAAVVLRWLK